MAKMAVNFQEVINKHTYKIDTDVDVILLTKNALPFENVDLEHYEMLADRENLKEFKLIDLSFLERSNEEGFPLFAVFSTDSKKCFIKGVFETFGPYCNTKYHTNFSSKIIRQKYLKHFKILACKMVDKIPYVKDYMDFTMELSSNFSGILPLSAREDIVENKERFDEIVVIAEADNWKLSEEVIRSSYNPDPLIIGIRKNLAYLISTFDITKLEDYVKREFTE
jgi:hypothetical protein